MHPMIEVLDLSYTYPDGRLALSNVSLQIMSEERIFLLGANGAGKSTLLLHLNGILTGHGEVRVDSLPVNVQNCGRIRGIVGLIFQNPDDQLFSTTVFDDVAYGLIYQGMKPVQLKEFVSRALEQVGMSGFEERIPYHLSGGEKKRIAIATVLAMHPEVLVFDEPTSGLDPKSRRELIELLGSLPQTMVIATHDLDLAAKLATRVVIMKNGRIVADGLPSILLADQELLLANGLA